MQSLISHNFEDHLVRTFMRDGEPWFVLSDVCTVLHIGNPSQAATRLDDDEKADITTDDTSSNGVTQARQFLIINESGLYSLTLTSRKPEARRFKKWITAELLPTLRKTGRYALAPAMESEPVIAANFDPAALTAAIAAVRQAQRLKGVAAALRIWQALGLPAIDADGVAAIAEDDLAHALHVFLSARSEVSHAELAAGMGYSPDDFITHRKITDRLRALGWQRVVVRRNGIVARVWRRAATREGTAQ